MEILAGVIFLIVGGLLLLAPVDDYRVSLVGEVMIVGGLVGMVWKAAQGSRNQKNEYIPPSEQPPTRD